MERNNDTKLISDIISIGNEAMFIILEQERQAGHRFTYERFEEIRKTAERQLVRRFGPPYHVLNRNVFRNSYLNNKVMNNWIAKGHEREEEAAMAATIFKEISQIVAVRILNSDILDVWKRKST